MEMLTKDQAWKFYLFLAPIGFLFMFIFIGLESDHEKASDKIIAAEFKNAKIDQHRVYEYRGGKTDEITIDNEWYLLNQDTLPNILVENILNYTVTKTKNSNKIYLSTKNKVQSFNLWTFDKLKYWRNRILISLFAAFFFIMVGFLNLKLRK